MDVTHRCPRCKDVMQVTYRSLKGVWQWVWFCTSCGHEEPIANHIVDALDAGR